MAWTLPKQTLTGTLSNSNLSGSIGIPKQLLTADVLNSAPVLVNTSLTVPKQLLVGNLDNPVQIVGSMGVPMQSVNAGLHYVFIAHKRFSVDWYLTETVPAQLKAPADVGRFAKQRRASSWWLTRPVTQQLKTPHDLGVWAKARLNAPYPLRLAVQAKARWRSPISRTHSAVYGWREVVGHHSEYSLAHPLQVRLDQRYDLQQNAQLTQQHAAIWALTVGQRHTAILPETARIRAQLSLPYGDANRTSLQHSSSFLLRGLIQTQATGMYQLKQAHPLANSHGSIYSVRLAAQFAAAWLPQARCVTGLSADYGLRPIICTIQQSAYALTSRSQSQLASPNHLALLNRSQQQKRHLYDHNDSSIQQNWLLPQLLHAGQSIEVLSASVSQDENSPYWIARIDIADLNAMQGLRLGDRVQLELGNTIFELQIDSRSLIRQSPADVRLSLTAISPLAWRAPPHGLPVTRIWDEPVWNRDVVAELLPGLEMDWQLVNDLIPANRLAATEANPVEIAAAVVRAAGGLIESQPDGRVLIRHRFPIPIPRYGQASASTNLALTEALDLFEISEVDEIRAGTNRLRITDGQSVSGQDQVEFVRDNDNPLAGTVRVIPSPWREVSLVHSGDDSITVLAQGSVIREENELVEFKAGAAKSQYPVDALLGVSWQYANLGAVVVSAGTTTLLAGGVAGYSLARIRYQTRAYEYRVEHVRAESIQFLVISP